MTNSDNPKNPGSGIAPTKDAATILLLRDGADGVEIFMLVRNTKLDFASGAMVFPGGAVDPEDRAPALRNHVPGSMADLSDEELAFRVAAIREAYEECGALLARAQGSDELINAERLAAIDARYATERAGHRLDMGRVAQEESLELACDLLLPFSHWITPTNQPKRFDTRFYIARAPGDHVAVHDGHESVESAWMGVQQICEEADAGKWHVMFPTRMNLERVGKAKTVDEALASAAGIPIVPILPELVDKVEGGRRLRIPEAAGYGVSEVTVMAGGVIKPER